MRLSLNCLLACSVLLVFSNMCRGAIILQYDFAGTTGDQTSQLGINPAAGITPIAMVRGGGLAGNSNTDSFSSRGWEGSDTEDFVSFGFSVAPTHRVDLTSLQFASRSTATGPGTLGLYASTDSFTTAIMTFVQPSATVTSWTVDLSGYAQLTGDIKFRLLEIGNTQADSIGDTAGTGNFRVQNFSATTLMTLNGTVHTVPEPHSLILLGAGCAMIAMRRQRRYDIRPGAR